MNAERRCIHCATELADRNFVPCGTDREHDFSLPDAALRTTVVSVMKHAERLITICREAAARHDDLSLDEQAAYADIGLDDARELLAKLDGGAS